MKAKNIIDKIELFCPKNLAYDWDNVGLLCGDYNKAVKNVFVTLDVTLNTVMEAIDKNADIIISHHPILLGGIKKIDYSTSTGQMLKLLIKNDIPVYAAHTNMDTASGGINDKLANMFSLDNIKIIEHHTDNANVGLGRYGTLKNEMSFYDFSLFCKNILNTNLRVAGNLEKKIKSVAVASGSCSEIIPLASSLGADVIITGDIKYHNMIDMSELDICIIDAGHYPTEICVMDIFEDILSEFDVKIIKSENKDIFTFI